MLTSNNDNNYTSIDDPIKTDSSSQSVETRLSRKDLCIYLIGIITGSLLIVFLFNKQIGMDYIYNNMYNNNYNNNHELNVESESVSTLTTTTTNVWFEDLAVGDTVKLSIWDSNKVLKNRDESNRIKIASNQDSDYVKWIVGYDSSRDAYSFENVEQGCYMQHASGKLKCLSGGGLHDKTYWKANAGKQEKHGGTKYQKLKNYDTNKCPYIKQNTNSDTISMSDNICDFADSYVDVLRYDD